jgi:hypothetical protein
MGGPERWDGGQREGSYSTSRVGILNSITNAVVMETRRLTGRSSNNGIRDVRPADGVDPRLTRMGSNAARSLPVCVWGMWGMS